MPSSKFRVGRSETGLGLFATKTIKKSAYIATYRGRRISSDEAEELENRGSRYMFELSSRWVIDGSKRYNVARYMNHSCRPNAEPFILRGRKIIFRALRVDHAGRGDHLQLRPRLFQFLHQEVRLPLPVLPQEGHPSPQQEEDKGLTPPRGARRTVHPRAVATRGAVRRRRAVGAGPRPAAIRHRGSAPHPPGVPAHRRS